MVEEIFKSYGISPIPSDYTEAMAYVTKEYEAANKEVTNSLEKKEKIGFNIAQIR